MKRYTGDQLRELRMPLGGIGAGCVSINGAGRLVDWEISGAANKNSNNGFTHFALKAQDADGRVWVRALHGDEPGDRMGGKAGGMFTGYGFGQLRETMGGMPHFPDMAFEAAWPQARLTMEHPGFPARATLNAFSPFIPLDSANSSLPAAYFDWEVRNTADRAMDYTLCFSVTNPFDPDGAVNRFETVQGVPAMVLENPADDGDYRRHGSLAAAVQGKGQVSHQEYWYRGAWFDGLSVFWEDLNRPGPLRNRRYEDSPRAADTATIAITQTVQPGEAWTARFVLCWYVPYMENDWSPMSAEEAQQKGLSNRWRKYYAVQYPSVQAALAHCLRHGDALREKTAAFVDSMTGSTLPEPVLDAALSTLSALVSPLTLRLPDGSFYGWEGLHAAAGSCEGSCTHVWNYAQALCFLFPDLERSMRDLDFLHNMDEDGGMHFRLQLPPGRKYWDFLPCADGHFGGVVKLWRDYLLCGDRAWLQGHWARVKRMLAYAWSPANRCLWDPEKSGVLTGRQHHTLDMELFGPNSWLSGMYLAALKAAAEMARELGDQQALLEYLDIFERGRAWVDQNLFNGEYFYHRVDLGDKSVLDRYDSSVLIGGGIEDAYWSAEHGQLKYQIGEGCAVDQVLGQWHANIAGLGDIFEPGKVRSALRSIHRYNFIPDFTDFFNPCRLFCVDGEAGTLICSYPEGRQCPVIQAPYAQETMHGFEYQAACHMVQEGMVDEGVQMVRAIRERYDGRYRNPFNEIECGSNYARSMASFALLPAFSGMAMHMGRGWLRFAPVVEGPFRCFFSVAQAWGEYESTADSVCLRIKGGALPLRELELPALAGVLRVSIGAQPVPFLRIDEGLAFPEGVVIAERQELRIEQV